MEVLNSDIWQAKQALEELVEERWPVKTAYWLARMAKAVNDQYIVLDRVRIGLVKKYGKENERHQIEIAPDSEERQKFVAEFNELLQEKTTIELQPVELPEATGDKENDEKFSVKGSTLLALLPFVKLKGE